MTSTRSVMSVGIIANPASGKDIRRLTAHATTVDNQGKISIVRRVLVGLGAAGVRDVSIMPDTHGLGARALEGLHAAGTAIPRVTLLAMRVTGQPEDSTQAAQLMAAQGCGCIIVLGGDGTARMVSKGCGAVPLLPISTGTNNVLPSFVEGTIAGLAAGIVAQGQVALETVAVRHKWLEVFVDGIARDRALIDVAVLMGRFVGARAVWNVDDLRQIIVTRADPASIGISAIAGVVRPISPVEPVGLALDLAAQGTRRVLAAIGPGLFAQVGIVGMRVLQMDETYVLNEDRPLVLALDGEREVVLNAQDTAYLVLHADGPWIVDAQRVMAEMVAKRLFDCDKL
jgi:predicted polyphosphate/ATP-dependent NAD kinase